MKRSKILVLLLSVILCLPGCGKKTDNAEMQQFLKQEGMQLAHFHEAADLRQLRILNAFFELFLKFVHAGHVREGMLRAFLEPARYHVRGDGFVAAPAGSDIHRFWYQS